MKSSWFPYRRPRANPRIRLFCFAHAGGAASTYRDWQDHLPESVEVVAVQLPGRESRFGEPFADSIVGAATSVVSAMTPLLDRPYALFGHSMGSLVAFEVARAARRAALAAPRWMCSSGARPPESVRALIPPGDDDDSIVNSMRELGGTPDEVLTNKELLSFILPTMRADYRLLRAYDHQPEDPLVAPLVVIGGADDRRAPLELLEGWRKHANVLEIRQFPGGHFFLQANRPAVFQLVTEHLAKAMTLE